MTTMMTIALVIAYPLLVHLAVIWPEPWLEWLALAVLCTIPLQPGLRAGRVWAWALFVLALSGAAALVFFGGGHWLLLLPPVAIPLSLFLAFAGSLRRGCIPMVTRFATAMRGPLPEDLLRYTRQVTVLWSLVFVGLTLSAMLLAAFGSREAWSVGTNLVHYCVIGAVFVLEYLYRRIRFRHHVHPGFWAYIRGMAAVRPRAS